MTPAPRYPKWMAVVLVAAGAYNLLWGAWTILFPNLSFEYSGLNQPGKPLDYPQLWQCIGMIVGVYGIGYALASLNPLRHWPIVLVGLLGKIFGPLGYVYGVAVGETRPEGIATIFFNDLIWWVPFFLILRRAYLHHVNEEEFPPADPLPAALASARDAFGVSLAELSNRSPVLVVFLRHFGCTYCREAVADVARNRTAIEADGTRVVFVHLGTPDDAEPFFAKYGLQTVARIADPEAKLYRAFGLRRGTLGQLFGWKSFARVIPVGILQGHGVGLVVGDGTRMSGAFLLHRGEVLREFRAVTAADRPDYCTVAGTAKPEPATVSA